MSMCTTYCSHALVSSIGDALFFLPVFFFLLSRNDFGERPIFNVAKERESTVARANVMLFLTVLSLIVVIAIVVIAARLSNGETISGFCSHSSGSVNHRI